MDVADSDSQDATDPDEDGIVERAKTQAWVKP